MRIRNLLTITGLLALTGCASAPKEYTFTPYQSDRSEAYNIAMQTSLTKDYWYGKTIDSPLKDFSGQEIEAAETNLKEYRAGNAGYASGMIALLSGNLTGIYSIAGGAFTNLGISDHAPSNDTRLIIDIPKSQFKTKKEAEIYIIDQVNAAREAVFKNVNKFQVVDLDGLNDFSNINAVVSDKSIPVGPVQRKQSTLNGYTIVDNNFSINGKHEARYTYGMIGSSGIDLDKTLVVTPTPFVYAVEVAPLDTTEFYIELTKLLPKGFYVYVPSMPQTRWNGKIYRDTAFLVPSIFTQGKKLEFRKPTN